MSVRARSSGCASLWLAVVLATAGWGGWSCTTSSNEVCTRQQARAQRCAGDTGGRCPVVTGSATVCLPEASVPFIRPEVFAAIDRCTTDNVPCGADGELQISHCVTDRLSLLQPTDLMTTTARAECDACPRVAGGTNTSSDDCTTALTSTIYGDYRATTSLMAYTDDYLTQAKACAQAAGTGSSACGRLRVCLAAIAGVATHDAGTGTTGTTMDSGCR